MKLDNKERLYLLRCVKGDIKKAESAGNSKKLVMLYTLFNKLFRKVK